jgi:hypothetical protein
MAIDQMTGSEEIRPENKQTPGIHPHMRPSPRNLRFQQYPRMLFKGPQGPTMQRKSIESAEEEKLVLEKGWRLHREVPPKSESDPQEFLDAGEPEAEVPHRRPGRPRKVEV